MADITAQSRSNASRKLLFVDDKPDLHMEEAGTTIDPLTGVRYQQYRAPALEKVDDFRREQRILSGLQYDIHTNRVGMPKHAPDRVDQEIADRGEKLSEFGQLLAAKEAGDADALDRAYAEELKPVSDPYRERRRALAHHRWTTAIMPEQRKHVVDLAGAGAGDMAWRDASGEQPYDIPEHILNALVTKGAPTTVGVRNLPLGLAHGIRHEPNVPYRTTEAGHAIHMPINPNSLLPTVVTETKPFALDDMTWSPATTQMLHAAFAPNGVLAGVMSAAIQSAIEQETQNTGIGASRQYFGATAGHAGFANIAALMQAIKTALGETEDLTQYAGQGLPSKLPGGAFTKSPDALVPSEQQAIVAAYAEILHDLQRLHAKQAAGQAMHGSRETTPLVAQAISRIPMGALPDLVAGIMRDLWYDVPSGTSLPREQLQQQQDRVATHFARAVTDIQARLQDVQKTADGDIFRALRGDAVPASIIELLHRKKLGHATAIDRQITPYGATVFDAALDEVSSTTQEQLAHLMERLDVVDAHGDKLTSAGLNKLVAGLQGQRHNALMGSAASTFAPGAGAHPLADVTVGSQGLGGGMDERTAAGTQAWMKGLQGRRGQALMGSMLSTFSGPAVPVTADVAGRDHGTQSVYGLGQFHRHTAAGRDAGKAALQGYLRHDHEALAETKTGGAYGNYHDPQHARPYTAKQLAALQDPSELPHVATVDILAYNFGRAMLAKAAAGGIDMQPLVGEETSTGAEAAVGDTADAVSALVLGHIALNAAASAVMAEHPQIADGELAGHDGEVSPDNFLTALYGLTLDTLKAEAQDLEHLVPGWMDVVRTLTADHSKLMAWSGQGADVAQTYGNGAAGPQEFIAQAADVAQQANFGGMFGGGGWRSSLSGLGHATMVEAVNDDTELPQQQAQDLMWKI